MLFTDFGLHGPYTGQMKAVLHQMAPGVPVVDLFADAPVGNPKPSAYLLAAYAVWFARELGSSECTEPSSSTRAARSFRAISSGLHA